MRQVRFAFLLATLLLALTATSAAADTKPVPCGTPQLTDPTGDAEFAQEDIQSAFVRSDGGVVTANIEIADLQRQIGELTSTATNWDFDYKLGSKPYRLRARLQRTGGGSTALIFASFVRNNDESLTFAGYVEGRLFEGANGIVQMRIPVALGGKPGKRIKAVSAVTSESELHAGVEHDHEADTTSAVDVKIANCTANAPFPVPCSKPQLTDVAYDGHHSNQDVLSGFFGYQGGVLTANVSIRDFVAEFAHEDDVEAFYRTLFVYNGTTYWVGAKLTRPNPFSLTTISYEYGTFSANPKLFQLGTFTKLGSTTGTMYEGIGGIAQVVVPASLGIGAGAKLTAPLVVVGSSETPNPTLDIVHWVDRGPGGEDPMDPTEHRVGKTFKVADCPVSI